MTYLAAPARRLHLIHCTGCVEYGGHGPATEREVEVTTVNDTHRVYLDPATGLERRVRLYDQRTGRPLDISSEQVVGYIEPGYSRRGVR